MPDKAELYEFLIALKEGNGDAIWVVIFILLNIFIWLTFLGAII